MYFSSLHLSVRIYVNESSTQKRETLLEPLRIHDNIHLLNHNF